MECAATTYHLIESAYYFNRTALTWLKKFFHDHPHKFKIAQTQLEIIIRYGCKVDKKMMRYLFEDLGFSVDAPCKAFYRHSPLMSAAIGGNSEALEYLIGRGARAEAQSRSGKTALMMLIEKLSDLEGPSNVPKEVRRQNSEKLIKVCQLFLDSYSSLDLEVVDNEGKSALDYAARLPAVRAMLEQKLKQKRV